MTTIPVPSAFHPQLTNARLAVVGRMLLEELYATETDLVRETDSGYTRGCTTFGRQHSRLVAETRSGKYPWLDLVSGALDVVFNIEGIPCRFSNDDPRSPTKVAVLAAGRFQMDFLEFAAQGEPGRFCFVIDRGYAEDQEPRVVFLGFTPAGSVACRWESDTVRMLRRADKTVPPKAVDVAKPSVAPKKKKKDSGDDAAASEVSR
jgi:hypothetical protein